ncbi:MAG TPA: VanZ family protein [Steroidobacteraceae bacterium]|nr:VanZ family protein [Steroidobacteraceae bacterium]
MSWLLVLTVAFIVYASLYPFDFDPWRLHAARAELARSLDWRPPPRTDLIANLIFYLPFGALLTYLTPRRWGYLRCIFWVLILGSVLSFLMECAQFMTRDRDPSITDVALNGASAAAAAVLAFGARRLGLRPALPQLRAPRPDFLALVLVGLWLAFHAAPFMPTVRFIRHLHAPWTLIAWDVSLAGICGFFAGYVLLGAVLRSQLRADSFWPAAAALAALTVLSRLVFRGQHLELNELLGLLTALPVIWQLTRDGDDRAYARATLCFVPALLFFALAPFVFSTATPSAASLYPLDLKHRSLAGEPGWLEAAFLYAGLVWLLAEAGVPIRRSLLWLLGFALLIELAHAWQPGKAAHPAAPLGVLLGAALAYLRRLRASA